jgi:hypothetical protein
MQGPVLLTSLNISASQETQTRNIQLHNMYYIYVPTSCNDIVKCMSDYRRGFGLDNDFH